MIDILFICGSLEPDKDGVGDYTRILIAELATKGYKCGILSLNDKYVLQDIKEVDEKTKTVLLRVAANQSSKYKSQAAKEWIEKLRPAIISLQYVPYAYNNRGLPFTLPKLLKQIKSTSRVHIMFHELWLGEANQNALKEKGIGFFQKRIAVKLVKHSNFEYVFTSNTFYSSCLLKQQVKSKIVPVFSNLPLGTTSSHLIDVLPNDIKQYRDKYIIACFFATVHHHSKLAGQISTLNNIVKKAGKKLAVVHVGKGEFKEEVINVLSTQNILFTAFGQQPASDITSFFTYADIGLSTYPKTLYEKSGSIAAMLNNQLPVILLREDFLKDNRQINELKELEEISSIQEFIHQTKHFSFKYSSAYAAEQYIQLLHKL